VIRQLQLPTQVTRDEARAILSERFELLSAKKSRQAATSR
jgi:hypothetical protein